MDAKTAWNICYGKQKSNGDNLPGPVLTYNDFSEKYDEVCKALGFNAPSVSAKTFMKQYNNQDTEKIRILDIACGTGLVGEWLRKYNFQGDIDGIDGSEDMIEVAKTKNVYRNLWCKMIIKDDFLLAKCTTNSYNGIIISASFIHLNMEAIIIAIKQLQPQSYVIITNRKSCQPSTALLQMDDFRKELSDLRIATLLSNEEFNYYEFGFVEGRCIPFLGDCFCFQTS